MRTIDTPSENTVAPLRAPRCEHKRHDEQLRVKSDHVVYLPRHSTPSVVILSLTRILDTLMRCCQVACSEQRGKKGIETQRVYPMPSRRFQKRKMRRFYAMCRLIVARRARHTVHNKYEKLTAGNLITEGADFSHSN